MIFAVYVAAFDHWAERLLDRQTKTCSPKVNEGELLPSQYACWYLANTRTLSALVIRRGFANIPLEFKAKVLGLLQDELQILGQCVELLNELGMRTPSTGSCDYLDKVGKLIDGIKRLGELEKWRIHLWRDGASAPTQRKDSL